MEDFSKLFDNIEPTDLQKEKMLCNILSYKRKPSVMRFVTPLAAAAAILLIVPFAVSIFNNQYGTVPSDSVAPPSATTAVSDAQMTTVAADNFIANDELGAGAVSAPKDAPQQDEPQDVAQKNGKIEENEAIVPEMAEDEVAYEDSVAEDATYTTPVFAMAVPPPSTTSASKQQPNNGIVTSAEMDKNVIVGSNENLFAVSLKVVDKDGVPKNGISVEIETSKTLVGATGGENGRDEAVSTKTTKDGTIALNMPMGVYDVVLKNNESTQTALLMIDESGTYTIVWGVSDCTVTAETTAATTAVTTTAVTATAVTATAVTTTAVNETLR